MAKDTYKSSGKFIRTKKSEEVVKVTTEPEVEPKVKVKKVTKVETEEKPTLDHIPESLVLLIRQAAMNVVIPHQM